MNRTDLLSALQTHAVRTSEDELLARLGAVASAPESLMPGAAGLPDAALILPEDSTATQAAVAPLLQPAVQ